MLTLTMYASKKEFKHFENILFNNILKWKQA